MKARKSINVLTFLLTLLLGATALAQNADWRSLHLTDARTGETFTLGGLTGQTVYVEPMATWCSNCRRQLGNVRDAVSQLKANDKVTFVALSVETTLKADELARYAKQQGFDFKFAVMSPEILRALAADFGQTIAVPPSTPHFVIYPDGTTSKLMTGFSSPGAIIAAVQP